MTTLVDEQVEAVARALARSDGIPDSAPVGDYARNARAALEALAALKRAEPAADVAGLCERLERKAMRFVSRKGFKGTEEYLVNPDGPEAAAALTSLSAQLGEAREVIREMGRKALSCPDSKTCCAIEELATTFLLSRQDAGK